MEMSSSERSTVSDFKEDESLTSGAQSLVNQSINQAIDLLRLFSLEAKLAVRSAIWVTVATILLAVIVVGLWITLQAIAILYLLHFDFNLLQSLFLLLFFNMLTACCLYLSIFRKLKYLGFNTTLKNLSAHTENNAKVDKNGL
jgi:hypothetical protein